MYLPSRIFRSYSCKIFLDPAQTIPLLHHHHPSYSIARIVFAHLLYIAYTSMPYPHVGLFIRLFIYFHHKC